MSNDISRPAPTAVAERSAGIVAPQVPQGRRGHRAPAPPRRSRRPNISRAQTVTLKMQGAWGAKDIFNDMAQEYVTRVNEMSGGGCDRVPDRRCGGEAVLGAGCGQRRRARRRPHVPVYWYGKNKAASLFGTGPVWGWNAHRGWPGSTRAAARRSTTS